MADVVRDAAGKVIGGCLNPGGRTPKAVRELHALIRDHVPEAVDLLLVWLRSDDFEKQEKAVGYFMKYGVSVPAMKSSGDDPESRRPSLTAEELRAVLSALREH